MPAGPWEKYAAPTAQPPGPWTKYGAGEMPLPPGAKLTPPSAWKPVDESAARWTPVPEDRPGGNWFAENAPKSTGGGNWFEANAPGAQQPPEDRGFFATLASDLKDAPKHFMEFISGHPIEQSAQALRDLTAARKEHQQRAADAYKNGDYKEAFHQLMFSIPVIGPPAGAAADEIQNGQPGQGAAHAVEALAPYIAPELSGEGFARVGSAVKNAPVAAVRAAGNAAGNVVDVVTSPVTRDVAGIVSPRASHVLSLAGRIRKALGTISAESAPAEAVEAAAGFRGSKYEQVPQRFGKNSAASAAPSTIGGEAIARENGADWNSLKPDERAYYEMAARARENVAQQQAAPRPFVGPVEQPAPPVEAPASPASGGGTVADMLRAEMEAKRTASAPALDAIPAPAPRPGSVEAPPATRPNHPLSAQPPAPEVTTVPSSSAPRQAATTAAKETAARTAKVQRLAQTLAEHGIGLEDARNIEAGQWRDLSKALGINEPSAQTVRDVLRELTNMRRAAAISRNPKAAAIAQQLRDEMVSSGTIPQN